MKQPIFITGIQRSGASLVARIIQMAGAWGGECNNMYENNRLRELMDVYYRDILNIPKAGQYPLPDGFIIPNNWEAVIHSAIKDQGYDGTKPLIYKDHRLGQVWEAWNHIFPNAKWIIVRRRSGDVINSCMKTGYMTAFQNEEFQRAVGVENEKEAWRWWVHWHERRFVEMIESGLNCKVIWPERMVEGDYAQMYETVEWLGLGWRNDMISRIEPVLWKGRKILKGVKQNEDN